MRVVNDNRENSPVSEQVQWASLPLYTLICALGFSSVFLSPFALILAHRRLPDFWPKVVSIGGALLAVSVLAVPLPAVLLSFVLGVFVADSVQRQVPLWKLLFRVALLTAGVGVLSVAWTTYRSGASDLWGTWTTWIDQLIAQAQKSPLVAPGWDWTILRNLLLYQGPFYFVAGCLLSVWLGIGLSAHLKWQGDADCLSSQQLRAVRLPKGWGAAVIALWVLTFFLSGPSQVVVAGIAYLGMVVLNIQGMIVVSVFLDKKHWRPAVRAIIYTIFALMGFYALVGLGLISPIIFNRNRGLIKPQNSILEEA